jgi:hypothetical protein
LDKRFNPEYEPDGAEISSLANIYYTPGFAVLHKIFMSELDKLMIALASVEPENKESVLARHLKMNAAGQYYEFCVERINSYVSMYTNIQAADHSPIDETEGVLDMGETYDPNKEVEIEDLPSFFGEAESFEESPI